MMTWDTIEFVRGGCLNSRFSLDGQVSKRCRCGLVSNRKRNFEKGSKSSVNDSASASLQDTKLGSDIWQFLHQWK